MAKVVFPPSGKNWRGMSSRIRTFVREVRNYTRNSPGAIAELASQLAPALGNLAAIVVPGATVTVQNSAASKTVAGATFNNAAGVVSNVQLPATAALITSGQLQVVTVSGTYTNSATYTVTAGVISAIVLS